jgi:hypothetical protein
VTFKGISPIPPNLRFIILGFSSKRDYDMLGILSSKSCVAVPVSPELRQLVIDAYRQHGVSVRVSSEAVRASCSGLSSKTTEEILEIRRHERAVSSETLAVSFA